MVVVFVIIRLIGGFGRVGDKVEGLGLFKVMIFGVNFVYGVI